MGKSGGGSQLSGYRYYFDLLMGICRGPVDAVVAIKVGDIEAWPGNLDGSHPLSDATYLQSIFNPGAAGPPGGFYDQSGGAINTSAQFSINKPNLFGGDKGEGGILGNCTVMMGGADQIIPDVVKLSIAHGTNNHNYTYSPSGGVGVDVGDDGSSSVVENIADISEFRGLVTIFYSGSICSNNPYPKVWKVRTQRAYNGWGPLGAWYEGKAMIPLQGGLVRSMNAAHMIYQCLTDKTWGRGLNRDELSEDSFVYAANYLFDEGLGLCMQWDHSSDISDFIQQIINHINAVLQINRGTGLIELRLIRDDYDPNAVPLFDYYSGLLDLQTSDTGASTVIPNEVMLKWHDPVTDQDRQIRVQDNASIQSTSARISDSKAYPGIGDLDVARRVALRDLRVYSAALKRFKLTMDRRAWKMQPGSVMKISAPDKGIQEMIVRVVTYDDGTLLNGNITIECTQDVFSMPSTFYTSDPGTLWLGPDSTHAAPPANQFAYEATYYDMQRGLSIAGRAEVTSTEGGVVVLAGRPSSNSLSTEVISNVVGQDPSITGTGTFAPVGTIREALDYYTSSFHLSAGSDLNQVKHGMLAVIEDEMVRIDTFDLSTGIVAVGRGVVDTIPKLHAAGAKIYFHDTVRSGRTAAYSIGETVDVSLLTRTARDVLDPGQATVSTVTITGRWAKPYPVGLVQINGYPARSVTGFFVSGDANITWASRNKIIESDQLIAHNEGPVTAESLTTYTVQIWAHGGAMLREYTGLTASSFAYTDTDAASYADPVELDIKLFTVVNGTASMDTYSLYVIHVAAGAGGYGGAYGFYYGNGPADAGLLHRAKLSQAGAMRAFFTKASKGRGHHRRRK